MKKVISVAIFSGMVVTLHSLSPKQPTAPGWPLGPKADCQCEPLYELLLNFTQHLNTACAQRRCAPALVRSPSRARQSRTPGPRALAWPHESRSPFAHRFRTRAVHWTSQTTMCLQPAYLTEQVPWIQFMSTPNIGC